MNHADLIYKLHTSKWICPYDAHIRQFTYIFEIRLLNTEYFKRSPQNPYNTKL